MAPLRALCALLGHALLTRSHSGNATLSHVELLTIEWRAGGAAGPKAPTPPLSKAPEPGPPADPPNV
eukprot:16321191-Heterocapsa_arctica.AAC.1